MWVLIKIYYKKVKTIKNKVLYINIYKMNDLNTATIYKISSSVINNVYIGSTKMKLDKRFRIHKNAYRSYLKNNKSYYTIFDIFDGGIENSRIDIIENVEYINNKEILDRERHHIMNIDNCVNKYLPNRSYRQYCEDNREIMKMKKHKYYEDNKDRFRQRYEDNKHKKN